jgi:hypothetical protein
MEGRDDREGLDVVPKKPMKQRGSRKRELINTRRDKRYVKRTASGRFKESGDVGKSLRQTASQKQSER